MKVKGINPGMIVYTCMIQSCLRAKKLKLTLQEYGDMVGNGIQGDRVLYNTLINGCVYNRNPNAGVQIMKDATNNGVKLADDVYNKLLEFVMRGQRHDEASEIMKMMRTMGTSPQKRGEILTDMVYKNQNRQTKFYNRNKY